MTPYARLGSTEAYHNARYSIVCKFKEILFIYMQNMCNFQSGILVAVGGFPKVDNSGIDDRIVLE